MDRLSRELRTSTFFINETRPERNKDGECLRLVLEWMVEVVMNGIAITRNADGEITDIKGFRKVMKLEKKDKKKVIH
jgi:hypothetical protein